MSNLKYGINKVQGSGTIQIDKDPNNPNRNIYKIDLPQRPTLPEDKPAQEQKNNSVKLDILKKISEGSINLPKNLDFEKLRHTLPETFNDYDKLEEINQNIINRQQWADAMIDDARKKYPGVDDDIRNNRQDHFNEFTAAYPDFLKLQQEQREYEKQFNEHPLNKQFINKFRNR